MKLFSLTLFGLYFTWLDVAPAKRKKVTLKSEETPFVENIAAKANISTSDEVLEDESKYILVRY